MRFEDFAVPEKVLNKSLPYEELVIVPIGDVHYGAKGFAERSFNEFLETVEREYPNAYFIGMGDYMDTYRTTVRKTFKTLAVDDGDAIDDYMSWQMEKLVGLLGHTEGRWLGFLSGNHTWEFREGDTVESLLCHQFDAPFLGDCADIQLKFDDGARTRGIVGMWVHHGAGGRKYPVGKLVDDICPHFPGSDIFLMGHTHVREYRDFIRLVRVGSQYVDRVAVAAITGGWLKGYTTGASSYIERKPMKPLAVGGLVVKVRPRRIHGIFSPKIRVEMV